jgi:hypothetical protein
LKNNSDLKLAVQAALDGDWEVSHKIAQSYSDSTSNWLHAVLHKIEGDEGNSRYWYARTAGQYFEEFADVEKELKFILAKIS